MSRYQAARRKHFLRGLAAAILMFTVFVGALSLAGRITAEQPATGYGVANADAGKTQGASSLRP